MKSILDAWSMTNSILVLPAETSEKLFDEIEIGEKFKSKALIHGSTVNNFSYVTSKLNHA